MVILAMGMFTKKQKCHPSASQLDRPNMTLSIFLGVVRLVVSALSHNVTQALVQ